MTEAVDQFISAFPEATQVLLQKMRATIRKAAPGAEETINYGIPTFKLQGNLVHFSGYKNHIGFYPGPSALIAFKAELAGYESAKGSVKFPVNRAIPYPLIARMVKFRVKENLARQAAKKK